MPYQPGNFRPDSQQIDSLAAPPPPPGGLSPEESAVLNSASEADEARMQSLESAAPEGEYSAQSLNLLVDSLNQVLPLFGVTQPYPTFAEDIDGMLPPEFVANLMMVNDAAGQSGLARMSFDVTTADDDKDLESVAGKLSALSQNDAFKSYLNTSTTGQLATPSEAPEPESAPGGPEAVTDEEFDRLVVGRI